VFFCFGFCLVLKDLALGGLHGKPMNRWYEKNRQFVELKDMVLQWKPCVGAASDKLMCPHIDEYEVVNLHIHSKQLSKFLSSNPVASLPK
jgi:hypothetical protein